MTTDSNTWCDPASNFLLRILHPLRPPRVGEVWTNMGWGLWFVVEADAERAVFAEAGGGERVAVPLGTDGQPSDGRGWSRSLGLED